MKYAAYLLVIAIAVIGCKKNEQQTPANNVQNTNPAPTSTMFPALSAFSSDVSWSVHYQGGNTQDPNNPMLPFWDTAFHFYSNIESINKDTVIDPKYQPSNTYHVYRLVTTMENKRLGLINQVYTSEYWYVRYDSTRGRFYAISWPFSSEEISLDMNMDKLASKSPEYPQWYKNNATLSYDANVTTGGNANPTLYMVHSGNKYVYQSAITGGLMGILNPYHSLGGARSLISVTYKYKSDSIRYDYPYVY